MRYRVLVGVPLAAATMIVGTIVLAPEATQFQLVEREVHGLKALALFGALVAAFSFQRGDYLARAWLLIAATYLLLIERDAVIHRNLLGDARTPAIQAVEAVVVLAANLCGILGTWILARAWRRAGLELPGSRLQRGLIGAAAVTLAVGITMPSLIIHLEQLARGRAHALVGVASNLGDIVGLSLVAPVLLTALALRGGPVAWPWALYTGSLLGWLFFDAALVVSGMVTSHAVILRGLAEVFRAAACSLAFSAGVAQRLSAPQLSGRLRALR